MKENTSTPLSGTSFSSKFPFSSEEVPFEVPSITTVTPGKARPVWSLTVPFTVLTNLVWRRRLASLYLAKAGLPARISIKVSAQQPEDSNTSLLLILIVILDQFVDLENGNDM